MLSVLGEAPRSSLTEGTDADMELALRTLDEVSREVQNIGWHWNSLPGLEFLSDVPRLITLPNNTLRIDYTPGGCPVDIVQRGLSLLNRKTNSLIFEGDLTVDVVILLEWDELPEAARSYIMIRAARKFADRSQTDPGLARYTRQDEQFARSTLDDFEIDTGDYTVFGPEHAQFTFNRRAPIY